VTVTATERAVTAVRFGAAGPAVGQAGDLPPVLRQAVEELREYFAGERREFTLPLAPAGTPFQQQVWAALREIPYGATCSYGRIAGRIGRPKACRAVGMANNRNPIAIVVPCHRVVGASGALVGYAAGLEVKEKLLALESMNNE
jgi:methylated-DNA-[protein]-cysteine S-methyltransferase